MIGIAFVIPAHGRLDVSALAFAGIRWTLDELIESGCAAAAVVIADDENLDLAREHGFDTLERENKPVGRKVNDGYQHAVKSLGADHVVSCGSDDWVHPDLIVQWLADHDESERHPVHCTRRSVVIRPDGQEAVALDIGYPGGDGVRLTPRRTLAAVGNRPTSDNRDRALDGGMTSTLRRHRIAVTYRYTESDPFWIVDFKSADNVTAYERFPNCEHDPDVVKDPLARMAGLYPTHLLALADAHFNLAVAA